ncbi:MAG TPA: hypothetical protein VLQ93_12300, partial [Myxococcaceae bacterium]|nr:hypothetical protein [Myxococcaceae bacterium]
GLGELQEWEAVEELRARHVLEDMGGGRLRFVHDKLREIAYEGISPERRRTLHREVALALEGRYAVGEVPPALFAALAHHWEVAGDDVWTFEYLEKAGAHALAAGAHREAAGWLRRALELDAQRGRESSVRVDVLRRARWERLLAEALFGLSDYEDCTDHCRRALEGLGRPLPASLGGWVRFLLRQMGQQVMHLLRPLDRVRAEDAGEIESQGAAALAAMRLAECYYWRYEPLQMAATALLAANLAERAGRDAEVLRLYGQLGSIAGMARLNSLARTYFRRALGEGQPVEDPSAIGFGLILECMYHAGFARWSPAAARASEAQRVLLKLGDRGEYELAVVLLGHVDFYTGRFLSALERFAEVRESARTRGHLQHEIWAPYSMARSLLMLGRRDEALPLLRESWALLERKDDLLSTIICGGLLARVHLEQGELELARERADGVMALARKLPPLLFTEGHGYEGAALTYLTLWERELETNPGCRPPEAELAREACARLRAFAMRYPVGQPMALRWTGRLHWLAGRRRRARAAWRRSIRLAREMGMLYDEAEAWLELARTAESGSTERETYRQEALGGFTRLGCVERVREAEALKARPIGG